MLPVRVLLFSFLLFHSAGLLAQQPRLVLPIGHSNSITHLLYSPDGKKVASGGWDKTIKIWEASTGLLLQNLTGHSNSIRFLKFTTDNNYLISADDNTIRVWDIYKGTILAEIKEEYNIHLVDVSPDTKKIAVSSENTAAVYNTMTGEKLVSLDGMPDYEEDGHSEYIIAMHFSPDNSAILTASLDGTVIIWDAATGKNLKRFIDFMAGLNDAVYSADGKRIATSSHDKYIKIWDPATKEVINEWTTADKQTAKKLAFSADGKKLISINEKNTTLVVWDVLTGKTTRQINSSTVKQPDQIIETYIQEASFLAGGSRLLVVFNIGLANIIDIATGKIINTINTNSYLHTAITSPDEKKIVTGTDLITVWNSSNGKKTNELKGNTVGVGHVAFSPDDKRVVADNALWDARMGTIIKDGNPDKAAGLLAFTPDGKKLITTSNFSVSIWDNFTKKLYWSINRSLPSVQCTNDNKKLLVRSFEKGITTIEMVDMETGQVFSKYTEPDSDFNFSSFSEDGRKVLLYKQGLNGIFKVIDATTGKKISYYKQESLHYSTNFSRDGNYIITGSADDTIRVLNATTTELVLAFKASDEDGEYSYLKEALFSPDGKKIFALIDTIVKAWSFPAADTLYTLRYHRGSVRSLEFSGDGSMAITASWDNTAKIWEVETGRLLANLRGHDNILYAASFSTDAKKAITTSGDNTIRIWDSQSGNNICSFFQVDSTDHFCMIPSGYYQCTAGAAKKLHYVNKDLKVITFEQLDVKYNRPDKVLEAIGNTDTALIQGYRKAWEKRIKKLGIDTTQFRDGYSVPEADISNRDDIEAEQTKGMLALRIRGSDSVYQLDRFNIWVNETPLFGQRGISIKKKKTNSIDTTIIIQLSQGENRIETSVTNMNGTESYRMPLYVNYSPAIKQKEMTRFIGIGIDQFNEPTYNLQYSAKDIRDLARKLKEKYKEAIIIDTLFNEKVTTENVKALKQKLLQTTVNDKVILSYSGHGLLSKDYDYYLSTYSVNFNKPEENGLPYDELENLLDSIPARKKLMLIDACHSGEVDKEDLVRLAETTDSLVKGFTPVAYKKEDKHLGLKNSFELMQSVFVNVGKSTGATIISAAAGTQFALERNDLKNGVFTYSILEAMKKYPTMKISELKKIVGVRVEQLTRGLQKPTSRNETIATDWSLW